MCGEESVISVRLAVGDAQLGNLDRRRRHQAQVHFADIDAPAESVFDERQISCLKQTQIDKVGYDEQEGEQYGKCAAANEQAFV